MKIIDPGHHYLLNSLDGNYPQDLIFVKRPAKKTTVLTILIDILFLTGILCFLIGTILNLGIHLNWW